MNAFNIRIHNVIYLLQDGHTRQWNEESKAGLESILEESTINEKKGKAKYLLSVEVEAGLGRRYLVRFCIDFRELQSKPCVSELIWNKARWTDLW